MKVLVCDDFEAEATKTAADIRTGWKAAELDDADLEVEVLASERLGQQLTLLFGNIAEALKKDPGRLEPTEFDERDIVFIDNNLAHLNLGGARHTAETVAGFIRAFSSVGTVVSLNRNPGVDFDLKHLIGDATSIADQALNVGHLALPGLWKRASQGDFRPWYWPELSTVPLRRAKQVEAIKGVLDNDVLSHLGFRETTIAALSRAALGALSGTATISDAAEGTAPVTFREYFLHSTRSVPAESDRECLVGDDDVVSRVVAAELEMWLRRYVLGPQEALVDHPHLLSRMGYLLGDEGQKLEAWNTAVLEVDEPFGVVQPLYDQHLKARRWEPAYWLDVAVYEWAEINADEDLASRFFSAPEWGDFVFCEDTSKFMERPVEGANAPQEFAVEVDGQWNRRFVAKLDGRKYAPLSRLAM
jgi:hypothetical protein